MQSVFRSVITSNIYNRVFFIRVDQYGTAFTVDIDEKQYLVTARHLVADPNATTSLKFMHNNTWQDLPVKLVGVGRAEVDIAVFATDIRMSPRFVLEPTTKGMMIGQDVYFVGYPYKMWTDAGPALAGRPCPFIKKGTLSSSFDMGDGVRRLFVDAINNEGFSGGPLVFAPHGTNDFQIAGVVSKFKTEREPVLDKDGIDTGMAVEYNTGFLIAYDINYVVKLIRANPIGLPIDDASHS